MKLLLEATEFVESLTQDVQMAKSSVYAQTLSFEADAGGNCLADLFFSHSGIERHLIIDSYTQHIINDRYLFSPSALFDRELQSEARGTRQLIDKLRSSGVGVKWVNPMGLGMRKISARNHKKIIGVDHTAAYIGGINFSQHNFDWHDLMIRFDEPEIVEFLKDDFFQTWKGNNQGVVREFSDVTISLLDGSQSELYSEPVLELLRSAKKSIFVESPYLSAPYYNVLGEMSKKGVMVTVLAPASNNWGLYDAYTRWEVERNQLQLRYYPNRMSHLKAILVDEKSLVVGSSNFDFFSYHLHQELMAIIREPAIVADFLRRVAKPDLAVSIAPDKAFDWNHSNRAKRLLGALFEGMHFLNKGRTSGDAIKFLEVGK
jgi:cardiolipin synthase